MQRLINNMFLLLLWLALVIWLLGCGATMPHLETFTGCAVVDRIESAGPGAPRWIVFDTGDVVAASQHPTAREGSRVCEHAPVPIADLWEPLWAFDCAETGTPVDACQPPVTVGAR
jgi:hypothetical protein